MDEYPRISLEWPCRSDQWSFSNCHRVQSGELDFKHDCHGTSQIWSQDMLMGGWRTPGIIWRGRRKSGNPSFGRMTKVSARTKSFSEVLDRFIPQATPSRPSSTGVAPSWRSWGSWRRRKTKSKILGQEELKKYQDDVAMSLNELAVSGDWTSEGWGCFIQYWFNIRSKFCAPFYQSLVKV